MKFQNGLKTIAEIIPAVPTVLQNRYTIRKTDMT